MKKNVDTTTVLQEWTLLWIKNKDIISRQIISIEEKKGEILATKTTGLQRYLIIPELGILKDIVAQEKNTVIVTLNTKTNVNKLLQQWNSLTEQPQLCILFVNPNSQTDQKWAVYPFTHHRIADSIEKGILAMFENVEEWRE